VGNFARAQTFRDDSDNLATKLENLIGHDSHQPNIPSTVHQPDPAAGERRANSSGGLGVNGTFAFISTTKDAHPPNHPCFLTILVTSLFGG
jgi:hypothetical protein